MNERPTQPDISRLPKWAQEYITAVIRQRDVAVRALNAYCDESTPSPFRTEDLECTGEEQGPSLKVRYIQAHRVIAEHAGVELTVLIRPDEPVIELSWGRPGGAPCAVALIPSAFQSAHLVAREHMRP